MAGEGHAVQGRHILALGAGGDDDDLILRQGFDLIDIHHQAFGDFQIAQLRGDLEYILHRAAGDGDLTAVFLRRVQNCVDAVHI